VSRIGCKVGINVLGFDEGETLGAIVATVCGVRDSDGEKVGLPSC
jgi:hypothetical protein